MLMVCKEQKRVGKGWEIFPSLAGKTFLEENYVPTIIRL
jgi:hypothetical protein